MVLEVGGGLAGAVRVPQAHVTVPSPPLASTEPSGDHASARTVPRWPSRVAVAWPGRCGTPTRDACSTQSNGTSRRARDSPSRHPVPAVAGYASSTSQRSAR